jgi:hypothetical protein
VTTQECDWQGIPGWRRPEGSWGDTDLAAEREHDRLLEVVYELLLGGPSTLADLTAQASDEYGSVTGPQISRAVRTLQRLGHVVRKRGLLIAVEQDDPEDDEPCAA